MSNTPSAFGAELERWRTERGKSQPELSIIAGYWRRHVSFLESRRSQPSRSTVITLAEALDVPVKARNALLHAAGFAPVYQSERLDSQRLHRAVAALETRPMTIDPERPLSAMRLCIDVDGIRRYIVGWHGFVGSLLVDLRHQLEFEGDDPDLRGTVEAIESDPEFQAHGRDAVAATTTPGSRLSLEPANPERADAGPVAFWRWTG